MCDLPDMVGLLSVVCALCNSCDALCLFIGQLGLGLFCVCCYTVSVEDIVVTFLSVAMTKCRTKATLGRSVFVSQCKVSPLWQGEHRGRTVSQLVISGHCQEIEKSICAQLAFSME